jgi:hypothetical protein
MHQNAALMQALERAFHKEHDETESAAPRMRVTQHSGKTRQFSFKVGDWKNANPQLCSDRIAEILLPAKSSRLNICSHHKQSALQNPGK